MDEIKALQTINRGFIRRGALIMSLFGLIWAPAGASGIPGDAAGLGVQVVALAVTAGIIARAWQGASARVGRPRHLPDALLRRSTLVDIPPGIIALAWQGASARVGRPRHLPDDWMRRFNLVDITQGIAIGLAVLALSPTGNAGLLPGAVCLIVGLAFLLLAGVFDQPEYIWAGAALCAVAALGTGALLFGDDETSRAVVGLWAGLALWAISTYGALRLAARFEGCGLGLGVLAGIQRCGWRGRGAAEPLPDGDGQARCRALPGLHRVEEGIVERAHRQREDDQPDQRACREGQDDGRVEQQTEHGGGRPVAWLPEPVGQKCVRQNRA